MAPEISCNGEHFEIEGNIIINEDKIDSVTTVTVNCANDCYRLRALNCLHSEENINFHAGKLSGDVLVNNVVVKDYTIPFDRFVIYQYLEK